MTYAQKNMPIDFDLERAHVQRLLGSIKSDPYLKENYVRILSLTMFELEREKDRYVEHISARNELEELYR